MSTDLYSPGERVVLAAWLACLAVLWLYLRFGLIASPSPCTVTGQPKVALWPLRYLRAVVTVETSPDWRTAQLTLYDPDGIEVRSSQVFDQSGGTLAPRHTTVEWTSLPPADPGDYALVLQVSALSGTCTSRDHVLVSGAN